MFKFILYLRSELEDVRQQLKKMAETKKEEKKRLADEDATRRIKQLEESVDSLKRQVANHKQEEETLLTEMEVCKLKYPFFQPIKCRILRFQLIFFYLR